jgi:hypothetical protein
MWRAVNSFVPMKGAIRKPLLSNLEMRYFAIDEGLEDAKFL